MEETGAWQENPEKTTLAGGDSLVCVMDSIIAAYTMNRPPRECRAWECIMWD
jgi:hypothetical protein